MSHARLRFGPWVALALLGLASILALGNAQTAQAQEIQFCWGKTMYPGTVCFSGTKRYTNTIYGSSDTGLICIGVWEGPGLECASGKGQGVWSKELNSAYGESFIWDPENQSATKVYGKLWTGSPPSTPPPPPPPPATWHTDGIAGAISSDPDLSSWGPGRLDLFARVGSGTLNHSAFSSTSWFPWEALPGGASINGGGGAVSWGPGRIDAVARGTNNSVEHWYWTGSAWGHDNLGTTITSDPDISSWGANRLDVFARGQSGELLHKYWGGAGWSGWESLGGSIVGGPSAVSWGPGRIDVVARATDNSIAHWWWDDAVGGGWHSDSLGGTLTSDPDISSWGPNRLDVFARGVEGALWHRIWGGGWLGWENMGGSITGGPGAVSWGPGRIDVVARDAANGSIIDHWWFQ